jgi:chloramphenicol 3-O-phosphotransferase
MAFPTNESNTRALAPSRGLSAAVQRGRIVLLDGVGRVVHRASNWADALQFVIRAPRSGDAGGAT